jgi:hypothetical protein
MRNLSKHPERPIRRSAKCQALTARPETRRIQRELKAGTRRKLENARERRTAEIRSAEYRTERSYCGTRRDRGGNRIERELCGR